MLCSFSLLHMFYVCYPQALWPENVGLFRQSIPKSSKLSPLPHIEHTHWLVENNKNNGKDMLKNKGTQKIYFHGVKNISSGKGTGTARDIAVLASLLGTWPSGTHIGPTHNWASTTVRTKSLGHLDKKST